ncbi:flavin reductase family protein [Actinosynnema sp. NPDC050436]|uniref:flavin reductase family protein n=1 Tax=Actinosynnema sp. NPDC050436 TaxID=3155659 RepID=UPI00340BBA83
MTVTDHRALRESFGHFATGVAVATYRSGTGVRGITVNSFTSVSLEPPLVMVSLARDSRANRSMAGSPFSVNVLAAGQGGVADHFAGRPSALDPAWRDGGGGLWLDGCLAHIDCVPWARYDGGDHVLHVGRVTSSRAFPGDPLIFWRGRLTGPPTTREGDLR